MLVTTGELTEILLLPICVNSPFSAWRTGHPSARNRPHVRAGIQFLTVIVFIVAATRPLPLSPKNLHLTGRPFDIVRFVFPLPVLDLIDLHLVLPSPSSSTYRTCSAFLCRGLIIVSDTLFPHATCWPTQRTGRVLLVDTDAWGSRGHTNPRRSHPLLRVIHRPHGGVLSWVHNIAALLTTSTVYG